MQTLNIQTPRWALPLLEPARYKGARGGRGCCHPDTPIDTPSGQIRISEFLGGEVYSWLDGQIVTAWATPAKSYDEQQLYKVTLKNGRSISVTDQHRFLTQRGWVQCCDLSTSDGVVFAHELSAPCHLPTNPGSGLSRLREDGRRLMQKPAGFLANYFLYLRQCGQRLLSAGGSGLDWPLLSNGVPPHNCHVSRRRDVLGCVSKYILSPLLSRLSSLGADRARVVQSFGVMESCSGDISFGRLSQWFAKDRQSHASSALPKLGVKLEQVLQGLGFLRNQGKTLRKARDIPVCGVGDSPCFAPSCNHDSPILVGVESICKHDRLVYWDLHVPGLENYLSSGIINHNSGKSHFFAELLIEEHVANPDQQSVCIREIQKSLKFSAKKLLESKIRALGVSHIFEVTLTEIRNKRGIGIIIFQGMQDHTADSVKSLEGFDRAWVEEAQNLSARSMQLLRPTIRKEGSQIWFGWNPDQPTDPVDELMCGPGGLPPNSVLVNVNYCDNPFLPDTLRQEMEFDRARNPDSFGWIWLGEYNKRSDSQVFAGKWRVDEFEPGSDWDGPYHGLDFGFANDPTAATKCWIHDQRLWIEREAGRTGLELDDTASYLESHIPGIAKYVVRADSARPESISYLRRPDPDGKRKHMPLIESVKK